VALLAVHLAVGRAAGRAVRADSPGRKDAASAAREGVSNNLAVIALAPTVVTDYNVFAVAREKQREMVLRDTRRLAAIPAQFAARFRVK